MPSVIYCSPESDMPECATLVSRDMIGLVALDFVLRIVFRRMMRIAFVIKVPGMDLDDCSRHPPCLGIPAHLIADFEPLYHLMNSTLKGVETIALDSSPEFFNST